jgi:hypothetical protein
MPDWDEIRRLVELESSLRNAKATRFPNIRNDVEDAGISWALFERVVRWNEGAGMQYRERAAEVQKVLCNIGWSDEPGVLPPEGQIAQVRALFNAGKTRRAIAHELGMSQVKVGSLLRRSRLFDEELQAQFHVSDEPIEGVAGTHHEPSHGREQTSDERPQVDVREKTRPEGTLRRVLSPLANMPRMLRASHRALRQMVGRRRARRF